MSTPVQPPENQRPVNDPLLQRYREANAQDDARPDPALRDRVLAHAHTMARQHASPGASERPPAANDGAWKLKALGSLAVLGLVGLLVLQFDRGTPEEQATAWGPAHPRTAQPPTGGASALDTEAASAAVTNAPPASAPGPDETSTPMPPGATAALGVNQPTAAPETPPPPPAAPRSSVARARNESHESEAAPARAATAQAKAGDSSAAMPAPRQARGLEASGAPAMDQAPLPLPQTQTQADAEGEAAPAGKDQRLNERSALARRSADGDTLLHQAAKLGDIEGITRALAQGSAVDAPDGAGRTALMLAAQGTSKASIERLLKAGASRTLRDRQGLNAADHARLAGHPDWLVLLEP